MIFCPGMFFLGNILLGIFCLGIKTYRTVINMFRSFIVNNIDAKILKAIMAHSNVVIEFL